MLKSNVIFLITLIAASVACAPQETQTPRKVIHDQSAEEPVHTEEVQSKIEAHSSVKGSHSVKVGEHQVPPMQENTREAMLVLHDLMQGNDRFVQSKARHALQSSERRLGLVSGQKPETIVLSCSDSRVPPEVIFDKGLGEIFVVRSAGEVADSVGLASIEYAIEHLHSKLLLVMGHSACGAVKAALSTPPGKSAGSIHLDHLVSLIRPAVKDFHFSPTDSSIVNPVRANVKAVAQSLFSSSQIIKHALESKQVLLVQGIYNLDSGKVEFWF